MNFNYINLFKLSVKWGYSKEETASLPANDATRVDGFRLFALPDLPPLLIDVPLFDDDLRALAAAQPTIAARSGQPAPLHRDVSLEDAQQAPLPLPNPFLGNHVDVAIADTARALAHSGGRYLHYGEGSNVIGNGIATIAQNRFYQVQPFCSFFQFSLPHV